MTTNGILHNVVFGGKPTPSKINVTRKVPFGFVPGQTTKQIKVEVGTNLDGTRFLGFGFTR